MYLLTILRIRRRNYPKMAKTKNWNFDNFIFSAIADLFISKFNKIEKSMKRSDVTGNRFEWELGEKS